MTGETKSADAGAVLTALHQSFYALYALLLRDGIIAKGQLGPLLRNEANRDFVGENAFAWQVGIADQLDNMDAGGRPQFGLIEGGKIN